MKKFKLTKKVLLGFATCLGFASCQAAPQTTATSNINLAGSEWGGTIERQFVQFGADGKLTGNGGCNRFFATYTQDGNTLHIGPIGSTKMACANLRQEQGFFQTLRNTKTFEASHLQLVLKTAEGQPLLTLKRKDWD